MLVNSPGKSVARQQQQGTATASPGKLVSQPAAPARGGKQGPARKQLLKEERDSPVQVNSAVASLTVTEPAQEPAVVLPPAPESIVELTPATYQDFLLRESSNSLVLVDFYTDWCGPCKLMDAHLHHLTFAFKGVKFAKFNCGRYEDFSTGLRIRSLPTFRLYHKRKCLEQLTGAQPVKLRQLVVHYFRPSRK
ncbi:thioredoxin-like protein [Dunaliella salina]|uniref:Thioredoxin-like protein n=1 Tax=Dunaliella salina TaxID=3046 RepID=A0ABQ7GKD5_DUNSA|nr:thioredoxin-like protein [Dunaliella salina]|eukprot:KAF5835077.1 thioredoxin-like protein [Dunaliella salina]